MSISIEAVSKAYGALTVLDHFSLGLPERGIVGLCGPSGCGKTTLLRLIAGLETPDAGHIDGMAGKRLSMVFQEDRLLPWLTAAGNVSVVQPEPTVVRFYLDVLQLTEKANEYPSRLSGGMCRRVSLARALAYGGDLFILDEPFKGMDNALKQQIYPVIRDLKRDSLVILVSHDAIEIADLADQRWDFQGLPLTKISGLDV